MEDRERRSPPRKRDRPQARYHGTREGRPLRLVRIQRDTGQAPAMGILGNISSFQRIRAAETLAQSAVKALGNSKSPSNEAMLKSLQFAEDAVYELSHANLGAKQIGINAPAAVSTRSAGLASEGVRQIRIGQSLLDLQVQGIKAIPQSAGGQAAAGVDFAEMVANAARKKPKSGITVVTQQTPAQKARTSFERAQKLLDQAQVAHRQTLGADERSIALHGSLGTIA